MPIVYVLLLTGSRGGYLSLTVVLASLVILRYQQPKLISLPIILGLLFFIFMPESYLTSLLKIRDPYAYTRVGVWSSALKAAVQRPILGWGLNTFNTVFYRYNFPVPNAIAQYGRLPGFALNEYLQLAVEQGFLATFIFIWIITIFLTRILRLVKESVLSNQDLSWWINGIFLCSLSILTQSLVDFNLHLPLVSVIFVLFVGIIMGRRSQVLPVSQYTLSLTIALIFCIISVIILRFLSGYNIKQANRLKQTSFEDTIAKFQLASFLNPIDSLPHQHLGDFYAKKYIETKETKWKELTIIEYNKVIRLEPENPFPHRSLGGFYYDYTQNKDLAVAEYKKAIERNPYNAFIHFELATIYLRENMIDQALLFYEKASELEPNYLATYYQIALIDEKKREYEKVIALYKKILEIKEKNLIPQTGYERKLLAIDYTDVYNNLVRLSVQR